jgi:hypothetical protein
MLEFFFFSKMGAPFCSLFNISDMHAGAVATSLYQHGEGSIHFSHFSCFGNEVNITSCHHLSAPTYCNSHYRDAGIVCRGNEANDIMCANIDLLIAFQHHVLMGMCSLLVTTDTTALEEWKCVWMVFGGKSVVNSGRMKMLVFCADSLASLPTVLATLP